MEQHPIPQQISSYQFRLVGDMTLKQFFQLAGGFLVSLLIYASNLHPVIKWPLIFFFALLGVALAFLPFEDRPLDRWIVSFFRSIYSPTIYVWQKAQKKQRFFQDAAAPPPEKIVAPRGEKELNNYLKSRADQTNLFKKLEETEKDFLAKITGLFGRTQAKDQPAPPSQWSQARQVGTIKIPEQKPIKVVSQKISPQPQLIPIPITPSQIPQSEIKEAQAAQFSPEAAPPMPPEKPNTISGQVMDEQGKIVEGAILEIRDIGGRPVRAVKTNKLGHFLIVTPLQNGTYEIITEKEGLEFDSVKFEAAGSIIPPIAIKAKRRIKLSVEENHEN
jgi:hypothetical protein